MVALFKKEVRYGHCSSNNPQIYTTDFTRVDFTKSWYSSTGEAIIIK